MLYLIESGDYIKVGYTKDIEALKKRMQSYRTHNPNFRLVGIKEYYDLTGKILKDSDYCKKMLKAKGNDIKQLSIQIRRCFSTGNRYSRKEVKELLNNIYSENGIERKAKHSDLREFGIEYQDKKIKGTYYLDIISKN